MANKHFDEEGAAGQAAAEELVRYAKGLGSERISIPVQIEGGTWHVVAELQQRDDDLPLHFDVPG